MGRWSTGWVVKLTDAQAHKPKPKKKAGAPGYRAVVYKFGVLSQVNEFISKLFGDG